MTLDQVHNLLIARFNESELRDLCFSMKIKYSHLPGEGMPDKAREFLAYLERHDRIHELPEFGKKLRPDIPWTSVHIDDQMDLLGYRRSHAGQNRLAVREGLRVVNIRPMDITYAFKDRIKEISYLNQYLNDNSVHLISVVGRSGMGKTALVSYVFAELEKGKLSIKLNKSQLDLKGILYLSARTTVLGLERIYLDIGRMLGEPTASRLATNWANSKVPISAKVEYLLEEMQDALYLIFLDNFENELNLDGTIREDGLRIFIEQCLIQPSGIRIIVTSRKQIKVPIAAGRKLRKITLDSGLPENDAIALLCELDPQGELGLCKAPYEELRRAFKLTRGIPRALEILAGILQDPTVNLNRLLSNNKFLGEQVVEELIAEGFRRLSEDEKRVMEALAIFDCPTEETKINFLLHPWFPDIDIRACLSRLVNSHFVIANQTDGEFSLHPLDHEYVYSQIPVHNNTGRRYSKRDLELRAANFYKNIRKMTNSWISIDDITPQFSEFGHRLRAGDYDNACLVLQSIDSPHLHLWGHFTLLVELREMLLGKLTNPNLKTTNLGGLGKSYHALGQIEQAISFDTEALDITRQIGDRIGEQRHLYGIGSAYRSLGQMEKAVEYLEASLSIARELEDHSTEGFCLGDLGTAYSHLGQLERAINLYNQALDIAKEVGEHHYEADWLGHLGRVYYVLGEYQQATEYCTKALAMSREVGDRLSEIVRLGNIGNIYLAQKQVKLAIRFYEDALIIAREIQYRRGECFQLLGLGRSMLTDGQYVRAQKCCKAALKLNVPKVSNQVATVLGIVQLNQQNSAAGDTFTEAVTRSRKLLDKSAGLYESQFALATALVGEAVCDPSWTKAANNEKAQLLSSAKLEYQKALDICSAPGVVQDALHDLEMIRRANIQGIESVFGLLSSTVKINQ